MSKIKIIFDRITKDYKNLKLSYKQQLNRDFSIDCGTDYARFILEELVYNENGESIY